MAVITPDMSDAVLQKGIAQIYPIVNELFKEATGRKDIVAVDTNSFIAQGQTLQQLGKTELWLNTLARRIGATVSTFRPYKNKYSDLVRTQMEWGAIVQKIDTEMPDAVMDKTYDVGKMDGQSVDQWIINNPRIHQHFYDKENAYSFFITIQTKLLKRAFLNESTMASLITDIFGKVQNRIELTHESLGRITVANLVLNLNTKQEFHLVTMYNNLSGAGLTPQQARYDANFVRYATSIFNNVSRKMETMSTLYNTDGRDRFTPKDMQRFYLLADYQSAIETIPEYQAYSEKHATITPDILVPYWQGSNTTTDLNDWNNITSIKGTNRAGRETHVNNLIGILFDRECAGTFRQDEEVLTTPVNARARYYNTFWHDSQFWFNMSDENAVAFYLD